MTHLEQRMEVDLNQIREWVWKIGEDVEVALLNAKKTLVLRDSDLAYSTVLGDQPINRDSRECDHGVFGRSSPVGHENPCHICEHRIEPAGQDRQ